MGPSLAATQLSPSAPLGSCGPRRWSDWAGWTAPPGAQGRGARGPRGAGGPGVFGWRARGLSPAEPPSEVPVSAWGRLSTAAYRAARDDVGGGERSSCAAAARGQSPRRGRFLGNGAPLGSRPPPSWSVSPPPLKLRGVRAPGPEAEPRCGLGGRDWRGRGDPRAAQLRAGVCPAGLRWGQGTRRARGGGDKSVSARPPPAPAKMSLSGGSAQPGPPSPASRNPPGNVQYPARAEGESRPVGGALGEAGEPGSWVPARAASPGAPLSIPVSPQGHPDRRFWKSFLGDSGNQGSRLTLLLYSWENGGTDCPKAAPKISKPRGSQGKAYGERPDRDRDFSQALSPGGLE